MSSTAPIAIVLRSLVGGGIERVVLNLAGSLADRGHEIDIVLRSTSGDFRDKSFSRFSFFFGCSSLRIGSFGLLKYFRRHDVRVHILSANPLSQIPSGFALKRHWPNIRVDLNRLRRASMMRRYILARRPMAILARGHTASLMALDGRYLADVPSAIIASLHGPVEFANSRWKLEMQEMFPESDAVVGVSRGVAESVVQTCGIKREKVSVIYNPVNPDIPRLREAEVAHPWLEDNAVPVILTVARIDPRQKDFPTLLSAFALVCEKRNARLLIVSPQGLSKKADPLIAQSVKLGVREKVDILGFDSNPYRYMRRASCFVLSAFAEGLPNVLIEALACGTPVVSTDVPYGPSEILEDGKWGKLVPIQDAPALASAIEETLDGDRPDASELEKRSRFFSADRATDRYEALIHKLVSERSPNRLA